MKKTFKIGNTEYTIRECTAICKDMGESERRKAIYVSSFTDSGEKSEYVIFDYDMPEDENQFGKMCEESSEWDGWYETIETVEFKKKGK